MSDEKYMENLEKKASKAVAKEAASEAKEFAKIDSLYLKELDNHLNIMDRIDNATSIGELPKLKASSIASYLVNNTSLNGKKLAVKDFDPVVEVLKSNLGSINIEFNKALRDVLLSFYGLESQKEIESLVHRVVANPRINYFLEELEYLNNKQYELELTKQQEKYKESIRNISNATSEKELGKSGLGEINKQLVKLLNKNTVNYTFKTEDVYTLRDILLNNGTYEAVVAEVTSIVEKNNLSSKLTLDLVNNIYLDTVVFDLMDIYRTKELRKNMIIDEDHLSVMDDIKRASRIRELPTLTTVISYLNGNSTIYSNDDRIVTEDLRKLSELLLEGHKWEDQEVKEELKNIAKQKYPDKTDAYELLYNKFSKLPKTYNLVEEYKAYKLQEKLFIANPNMGVYSYDVEDKESSKNGGRFLRSYISTRSDLDLATIASKFTSLDSLEEYVREKADPMFTAVGGKILCEDEFRAIKNKGQAVSVVSLKQNDGLVGVTEEEKTKLDTISDLDKKIAEKKQEYEELKGALELLTKEAMQTHDSIVESFDNTMKSIENLKVLIAKNDPTRKRSE